MAAMPMYDKDLKKKKKKKRLLQNQKADDLETWYVALGVQVNYDPGLTLTYFKARSNLVPYAFVWEKGKIMDFSETIVVYDIKVGGYSKLNEYVNLHEYQRSRSFIDLGPRSLRFNIFKFLFLRNCWPIEAKFYVEPPWDGGTKV